MPATTSENTATANKLNEDSLHFAGKQDSDVPQLRQEQSFTQVPMVTKSRTSRMRSTRAEKINRVEVSRRKGAVVRPMFE